MYERYERNKTYEVVEGLEVVACPELVPEVVDGDEVVCVLGDDVAHGEDVEATVDADWTSTRYRLEERDFALDGVQERPLRHAHKILTLDLVVVQARRPHSKFLTAHLLLWSWQCFYYVFPEFLPSSDTILICFHFFNWPRLAADF